MLNGSLPLKHEQNGICKEALTKNKIQPSSQFGNPNILQGEKKSLEKDL